MEIQKSIFSLVDRYDAFFVDVYGVLFNGVVIYEHALETLRKLKELGKKIVILSNTTQVADDAKNGYAQRGMISGVHYDQFVTSGEFLHHTIQNNFQAFCKMMGRPIRTVKCIFMGNGNVFANTSLHKVDNYNDADFLYIGIPRISYGAVRMDNVLDENDNPVKIEDVVACDWHRLHDDQGRTGFSKFARQLELCLEMNKTLLIANPDVFAHGSLESLGQQVPIVTQGCLGDYYERLGGKVVRFGKPYKEIFQFAKSFVDTDRIAMIGDTPWTDIAGANAFQIDSIMVTTGVVQEFFKKMPVHLHEQDKLRILFDEIAPRMAHKGQNCIPTFVIEKLC